MEKHNFENTELKQNKVKKAFTKRALPIIAFSAAIAACGGEEFTTATETDSGINKDSSTIIDSGNVNDSKAENDVADGGLKKDGNTPDSSINDSGNVDSSETSIDSAVTDTKNDLADVLNDSNAAVNDSSLTDVKPDVQCNPTISIVANGPQEYAAMPGTMNTPAICVKIKTSCKVKIEKVMATVDSPVDKAAIQNGSLSMDGNTVKTAQKSNDNFEFDNLSLDLPEAKETDMCVNVSFQNNAGLNTKHRVILNSVKSNAQDANSLPITGNWITMKLN